jgi:hydrogenase maturation factor
MTRALGSLVGPVCDHREGCITCGDTAVAMTVERVDGQRGLALCRDEDGAREAVEIDLVGVVRPGDALLVHAGTALQRLDRAQRSAGGRANPDEWTGERPAPQGWKSPGGDPPAERREVVPGREAGSAAEL